MSFMARLKQFASYVIENRVSNLMMIAPQNVAAIQPPPPVVLDTNVLIHIYALEYKPATQWLASLISQNNTVIVPSIVINEFMYAKNPQHGGLYVRKRDIVNVKRLLEICQFDAPVIEDYINALARVSALYGKSSKLGFADAVIAECVLRNNAQLCTYDEDFAKGIPEVQSLIIQPYSRPLGRFAAAYSRIPSNSSSALINRQSGRGIAGSAKFFQRSIRMPSMPAPRAPSTSER